MEPPDRLEKKIRFGCGFLLGCFLALTQLLVYLNGYVIAATCMAVGTLCGFLAIRFGDRFWHHVIRWWI